ncbi:class A beta-lactamase [Teichococcus aerofrigidensis]
MRGRRDWMAMGLMLPWGAAAARAAETLPRRFAAIEAGIGGRLGVAVRVGLGRPLAWRGEERFPMTSTFKTLAAAATLHRVDAGQESLSRRVVFGPEKLVPYAPVTGTRVGGDGMRVEELCEAAVTRSDNVAGNLLLEGLGGPEGLTAWLRRIGDPATRLDRWETALNEARPGDPRDTTTPLAMLDTLHGLLLGEVLSAVSRARLLAWLAGNLTGDARLRAGLPAGWRAAEKTGSGERGSTNDAGLLLPPGDAPPILVAAYLTGSGAPLAAREAALAEVARAIVAAAE